MTAERAIELLSSGTRMPDVAHTVDEMDEACRMACDALRAQLAVCSAAGKGTYRCYVMVPGYDISCDKCLASEIRMLNDMGIRTIGCCCGHGADAGYIQVEPKHINAMKQLGYVERELDAVGNGQWCFKPKSFLPTACIEKLCNEAQKLRLSVKTPLGDIVAEASTDPDNPGMCVSLHRDGEDYEPQLALVEYTADEADREGPVLITRVWGDARQVSYTDRVVHTGLEMGGAVDEH